MWGYGVCMCRGGIYVWCVCSVCMCTVCGVWTSVLCVLRVCTSLEKVQVCVLCV